MSKRFTDTEKWRDPWFCGLTTDEKLFWSYLCDTCTLAGIWQVNWSLVKFYIPNFTYDPKRFENRIQELSPEKWFVSKFIEFQYGKLQAGLKLHDRIIFDLKKEGVSIPSLEGMDTPKDKDRDKDKVKDKDTALSGFELFWLAYPRKVGKGAACKAWLRINPNFTLAGQIIVAVNKQKRCAQWLKDSGDFIPHPSTWLNQMRWEDEVPVMAGLRPADPQKIKESEEMNEKIREREWLRRQNIKTGKPS